MLNYSTSKVDCKIEQSGQVAMFYFLCFIVKYLFSSVHAIGDVEKPKDVKARLLY